MSFEKINFRIEKEDPRTKITKDKIEKIFDSNDNGLERVDEIVLIIRPSLGSKSINFEEIKSSLRGLESLEKELFVERVFEIVSPLIESGERVNNFIKINEALSYHRSNDSIHIHLSRTDKNPISLVKDGLRDLAKIVEADETIKEIRATSPIVARGPELLENKFGFQYKGGDR